MLPSQIAQSVKSAACRIGFDWVGICPAVAPPGLSQFHQWLEAGYHGEMQYLDSRRDAYSHPDHVMNGTRSIVMLAMSYRNVDAKPVKSGQGIVSRYAWGESDYHDLIHRRLKQLRQEVAAIAPGCTARGVVDTAPLLEREFAVLAGLGWQGKNTLILNKHIGSWFFLAALLVDFEMEYDAPHSADHCGTCRACLDACPTDAFVGSHLLDATRCISYLTIELNDPVPVELRSAMGDHVFGCDVCQDVCPWNYKATCTQEKELLPAKKMNPMELSELFDLDDDGFRARFRKTPLWRSRRRGILRNAAIILGNQKNVASVPSLEKGLNDVESLIRGASAWALGQIGGRAAVDHLHRRLSIESEDDVRHEIEQALSWLDS